MNGDTRREMPESWRILESRICEQIRDIDLQVDDLWRERDRLNSFLITHGMKCA